MEYNGYILEETGFIIDENNIDQIKRVLDESTSDAILFTNYRCNSKNYRTNLEGLTAQAYNISRDEFIGINECLGFTTPSLYGFVKKEFYNGENTLMNLYHNENIKTVTTTNVVLGARSYHIPKVIKDFILTELPEKNKAYYLDEKTVEENASKKSFVSRVKRKLRKLLK